MGNEVRKLVITIDGPAEPARALLQMSKQDGTALSGHRRDIQAVTLKLIPDRITPDDGEIPALEVYRSPLRRKVSVNGRTLPQRYADRP